VRRSQSTAKAGARIIEIRNAAGCWVITSPLEMFSPRCNSIEDRCSHLLRD